MRFLTVAVVFFALVGFAYAADDAAKDADDSSGQPELTIEGTANKTDATNPPPSSFIATKKSNVKKYYLAKSLIVPQDWAADGSIIGDPDKKLLISEGDSVYVNLGSDKVKPGSKCEIFRILRKIKDPKERIVLGYEVMKMGTLEMTGDVGEKASTAKIVTSNDPVQVGDVVKIIPE